MRQRTKIAVGAFAVALALAAAVGTASARRFEISEQRFLMLFRELTYKPPGGSEEFTIVCNINLEGSFHSRTISKVSGQLIGYITEAIAHQPCIRGEWFMLNGVERIGGGTAPNTLPWHITYATFTGTLPSVATVEVAIKNYSFLIENLGIVCLFQSTEREPIRGSFSLERGSVTMFGFNARSTIPRKEGSILCPERIGFVGSGSVGTQTGWSPISIRLVQ